MIGNYVRFLVLCTLKAVTMLFYKMRLRWINPEGGDFTDVRLVVVLNHTSLFEPLFVCGLPWRFMWEIASRAVYPAADITMNRPLVGKLYKLTAPNVVSISRKRDDTWSDFLGKISQNSMVMIAPEGRMKRPNGLDKHGNKMTVRGGIAEIISQLKSGKMLIAYSGGLHHIHAPGDWFPKPFKTMHLAVEQIEITEFLQSFSAESHNIKEEIAKSLELRRDQHCPV